jgi:DNA-binding NarL/FixJ family response regulator
MAQTAVGILLLGRASDPAQSIGKRRDLNGGVIVGRSPVIGASRDNVELAGINFRPCSPTRKDLKNAIARFRDPWILLGTGISEGTARTLWALATAMRPAARLVVQGPPDDLRLCDRWLRRGCDVYVSTRTPRATLEDAMRIASALNVRLVSNDCLARLPQGFAPKVTDRETEILQLISEGLHNDEIAVRLGLTENTIEFHVGRVLDRLGARNRVQATADAIRAGLI